jgi:deazaflavin-dependent oxidoreductase (nitroreductase family)
MTDYNATVIDEFRSNSGVVRNFGDGLVILHSTGARSGAARVNPIVAIRDGDSWLVAASKAGAPDNPAWFHNLVAHPDAAIEAATGAVIETIRVHATVLTGAERDEGWSRFTTMSEGFRQYEQRTSRVIPVVRLSPAE